MKTTDKIGYFALQSFISILGKLSIETGTFLGKLLGKIWFALDKRHTKIVIDNLSHAYRGEMSEKEIIALARKIFNNSAGMLFEYAWFYNSVSKNASKFFRVEGIEHIDAAYKKNKGVLLLSAHLGNFELLAGITTFIDYRITVVYKRLKSKPFDMLIQNNRASVGAILFPMHNAFDGVSEALERRELIGLLMDQNTRFGRGVFIDFFGRKACANPGLAKLALQTGAPVIPVFLHKEGQKFIIEIQPEIPLVRTGNEADDILINTQNQNNAIEKIIRKYPDQWFWIHNRWKTRPAPEA